MDMMTKKAILKNRSNCVVVYDHTMPDKPWHTNILKTIITPENKITRQEIVAVANLGYATTQSEIVRRLSQACTLSGLECMDLAYFEVQYD